MLLEIELDEFFTVTFCAALMNDQQLGFYFGIRRIRLKMGDIEVISYTNVIFDY